MRPIKNKRLQKIMNDLQDIPRKPDALEKRLCKLEKRLCKIEKQLAYAVAVAKQYESMFAQIEQKLTALGDRQGNIQAVYDYMVKVGSQIAKHNPNGTAFLIPNDDPKRLKDR